MARSTMHFLLMGLLLQASSIAAAPGGIPHDAGILPNWMGGLNNGNDNNKGDSGSVNFNNNHGGASSGNEDSNNDDNDSSYVSTCANAPTVTITSGGGSCTATMFATITACTATTTDYVTVTDDLTITTAGPTTTVTTTETTGVETVTDPAATETITSTTTVTDVDTVTDHQIETTTVTNTATVTLQVTTTVTADGDCEVTSPSIPGYGSCGDPTIVWEYGLDGRTEYAYTTTNQADFPFGSSPSIDPVTALICNRLRSPCNAPDDVVDRCWEAAAIANQFEGQEAADVWNELMT